MKKRKNSGLLLFTVVIAAAGCTSDLSTERVRLEVPGKPEFMALNAPEIILAGLWVEAGIKDLDLSKEISSYWKNALKREFKGRLTEKSITWTNKEILTEKEPWIQVGQGSPGALILAGKVSFVAETRKALVASSSGKFDGPWDTPNPWAENKNFSLNLEVVLLKAEDGNVAFRKEYRESLNTENKKPTAAFALHDLLDRIAPKLLSALFGSPRSLDRYLLTK